MSFDSGKQTPNLSKKFIDITKANQEINKMKCTLKKTDGKNSVVQYSFDPSKALKTLTQHGKPGELVTVLNKPEKIPESKATYEEETKYRTQKKTKSIHIKENHSEVAAKRCVVETATLMPEKNEAQRTDIKHTVTETNKSEATKYVERTNKTPKEKTNTNNLKLVSNNNYGNQKDTNKTRKGPSKGQAKKTPQVQAITKSEFVDARKNSRGKEQVTIKSIAVGLPSDKQSNWITGIAIIGGHLFVTDYGNLSVKILSTHQNKILQEIQLPSQPWDITKISNKQLATTLPNTKAIAFLKKGKYGLWQISKTLIFDKECYGIAYVNSQLAVLFAWSNVIQIMNLDGTRPIHLNLSPTSAGSLARNLSLSISSDMKLYISNSGNNTLACMAMDGHLQAIYSDSQFRHPRKAVQRDNGDIFLCDRDTNSIFMIKAGSKKAVQVLTEEDSVKWPQALTWCHKTGQLYVGMWDSDTVQGPVSQSYLRKIPT